MSAHSYELQVTPTLQKIVPNSGSDVPRFVSVRAKVLRDLLLSVSFYGSGGSSFTLLAKHHLYRRGEQADRYLDWLVGLFAPARFHRDPACAGRGL